MYGNLRAMITRFIQLSQTRRKPQARRASRGFTLIEMVVTIVILGILGLFGFSFFSNLTSTYTTMDKQTRLYQEAACAMERISRELRDAQRGVVVGPPLSFHLSRPTPADPNVCVRYSVSGSNLVRQSGPLVNSACTFTSPERPIAQNVGNATDFSVVELSPAVDDKITPANTVGPVYQVSLILSQDGQSQSFKAAVSPKNYSPLTDGACIFAGRNFGGCYEDKVY